MKLRTNHVVLSLILAVFASLGFSEELKTVRLQLKWKHQFQFAGYYAAIEQGYYKAAGLNVQLLEAQPNQTPFDAVFSGKAEFGTCTTDILGARSEGYKPVVLADIFQHSPHIIIAMEDSGIRYVHDLVGKKIAAEPGAADLYAYLLSEGVTLDRFSVEELNFSMDKFINREVDAITAYSTDEIYPLRKAGYKLNILWPTSSGIDFYGDLLFTSEALLKKDPALVEKFTQASLKGWRYALDNEEEIVNLIYDKYSQRHSLDHLRFEAAETKKLILPDVVEIGYTNPGRWQFILDSYKKLGRVDKAVTLDGMLYADFKPQPVRISWKLVLLLSAALLIACAFVFFFYTAGKKLKREIQSREAVQNKLAASEELYRFLTENIRDVIWVMDLESNSFTFVSPSVEKLRGYTVAEILQQPMEKVMTTESRVFLEKAVNSRLESFLATGVSETYSDLIDQPHKDGRIIHTEALSYFRKNPKTGKIEVIGSSRDVTKRIEAESKLKKSEAKFSKVFKSSPFAIVITSIGDGRFLDLNDAVEKYLGYSKEEMLGKTSLGMGLYVHPEDRHRLVNSLLTNGTVHGEEVMYYTKSREVIVVNQSMEIIEIDNQKYIISLLDNITDRKNSIREITRINQELTTLNIEKNRFYSIIAHDLRSPFNAILGITQMLVDNIDKMEHQEVKDHADDLNQSAKQLYSLLDNLLEWSKIEQGLSIPKPKLFSINEVIDKSIDIFSDSAREKHLTISTNTPKEYKVFADRQMVEVTLRNLLSNAVKYTSQGGNIIITTGMARDGIVSIAVQDTGIGMSRETVNNLFRIDINNYRPGTEGELSTGLGLLLCKEFIELNGGELQVESQEGKGSTFTFSLKLAHGGDQSHS